MKEFCVLVKGVKPARELICDYCSATLEEEFYAKIYEEGERFWIEDYVCPECREKLLKDLPVVELQKCDPELREAIKENLQKPFHGYIVSTSSPEELLFLLSNPFLIPFFGEEF